MRVYKYFSIVGLAIFIFLSGCAKDEVVPMTNQTQGSEQQIDSEDLVKEIEHKEEKEKDSSEKTDDTKEPEANSNSDAQDTTNSIEENTGPKNKSQEQTVATSEDSSSESETNVNKATAHKETNKSQATPSTNKEAKATSTAKTEQEKQTNQPTTSPPPNKKEVSQPTESKETEAPKQKAPAPAPKEEPKQTVTVQIVGDSGTILPSTKVELKDNQTVLDVTLSILKQKGIPISVRGSGATAYVEGINNLFEFDRGPYSGWTVKLNGSMIPKSSGVVKVKNGDTVQWRYTTNYLEDEKNG
ncbi:DUF4430 domain-containing protein [Metabacillus malikii]|uniref:Chemotaxis protein histidine kinase CheA n=1 Tax=Metabacillus malikii TaxID=1504265 RepID=A0ABT9ZCQ4_9BACI|nr:DUF4430 domain-containing protein [Metabacillus malikii]MDQ0229627.1 chemotaxis protein histidine kinase CheA [Metabacillus malikii]